MTPDLLQQLAPIQGLGFELNYEPNETRDMTVFTHIGQISLILLFFLHDQGLLLFYE